LFQARERAPLPDNCIEQFLGPAIAESDMVQNSKLTAGEANALEAPLTIEELDASVMKGTVNFASTQVTLPITLGAPGSD
jgi:hypothetical protein